MHLRSAASWLGLGVVISPAVWIVSSAAEPPKNALQIPTVHSWQWDSLQNLLLNEQGGHNWRPVVSWRNVGGLCDIPGSDDATEIPLYLVRSETNLHSRSALWSTAVTPSPTMTSADCQLEVTIPTSASGDVPLLVGALRAGHRVHWLGPAGPSDDDIALRAASGAQRPTIHVNLHNLAEGLPLEDEDISQVSEPGSRRLQDEIVIKIIVPWTPRAECEISGLVEGCLLTETTALAMRALIDQAIAQTNTALENSGATFSVALADAYRAEGFVEAGARDTLLKLFALSDGILDDITEKREDAGGDLVLMILADENTCVSSNIGEPVPAALLSYGVIAWDCATQFYSFAHAIGHVLGCRHDRQNLGACTVAGSNFGYRDPDARYRDIMAQNCNNGGQCDPSDVDDEDCAIVPYFSFPGDYVDETGQVVGPIGDALNNCMGQMDGVAQVAADFYDDPIEPTIPPTPVPSVLPTPMPTAPSPEPTPQPSPAPNSLPLNLQRKQPQTIGAPKERLGLDEFFGRVRGSTRRQLQEKTQALPSV